MIGRWKSVCSPKSFGTARPARSAQHGPSLCGEPDAADLARRLAFFAYGTGGNEFGELRRHSQVLERLGELGFPRRAQVLE